MNPTVPLCHVESSQHCRFCLLPNKLSCGGQAGLLENVRRYSGWKAWWEGSKMPESKAGFSF